MSRAARVLSNVSIGYVQLALTMGVGLWLTPFTLHHVGRADFGLWSASLPILTYIGLVDFGVVTILQREVAFAFGAAEGDHRRAAAVPALIGKTFKLVLLQCPVLVLAAAAVLVLLPPAWHDMRRPFAILFGALILGFPLRIGHAVLYGLQDLAFVAKIGLVNWIIATAVAVLCLTAGYGLTALALSWAVSQLLGQVACVVRLVTTFNHLVPRGRFPLTSIDFRERLGRGFWVVIAQVAAILCTGSDTLVIAARLSALEVVPYALTGKLVTIVTSIPLMVAATAQPALSELRRSPSSGRLREICTALNQAVLLLSGFFGCCVIALDRAFVGWWVGAENFAGGVVVHLLVLGMILSHLGHTIVYAVFAFGHERRVSVTTVVQGILTFGIALCLVRPCGVAGAAVGTAVGFAVATLPANLLILAHETGQSVGDLLRPLWPWGWRFIVLCAASACVARYVPATLLGLAVGGVAIALVYSVVMFPISLREPLGQYTRPRLQALRTRIVR